MISKLYNTWAPSDIDLWCIADFARLADVGLSCGLEVVWLGDIFKYSVTAELEERRNVETNVVPLPLNSFLDKRSWAARIS